MAVPETDATWSMAQASARWSGVYAELLGAITRHRPALAVAGSHGKTTVTAWIVFGLKLAGRSPGYLIGGGVPQLGSSAAWGDGDELLVLESCEYDRTFHKLSPRAVALLNVDAEHPDTYPGGYDEVKEAFGVFLNSLPQEGAVLAGPEAPDLAASTQADWQHAEPLPAHVEVGLPGPHNRLNGALVAATLRWFGVEETIILEALRTFGGADRRLEEVGTFQGAPVISDYAHHPKEVAATLAAVRERWSDRRLVTVFQPHQARRFDRFRAEFTESLDGADAVVLLPVYRARDPEDLQPETRELLNPLQGRRSRPLVAVEDAEAAQVWLMETIQPGDLVLCLGAGNIDALARGLVAAQWEVPAV